MLARQSLLVGFMLQGSSQLWRRRGADEAESRQQESGVPAMQQHWENLKRERGEQEQVRNAGSKSAECGSRVRTGWRGWELAATGWKLAAAAWVWAWASGVGRWRGWRERRETRTRNNTRGAGCLECWNIKTKIWIGTHRKTNPTPICYPTTGIVPKVAPLSARRRARSLASSEWGDRASDFKFCRQWIRPFNAGSSPQPGAESNISRAIYLAGTRSGRALKPRLLSKD
ncbi:hypothetical protein B0H13DRAFT_1895796 [Mycena leptocephala]|nr:hypothetical protein B0H13DRAFT_1895796 [Mycena leptocephala]